MPLFYVITLTVKISDNCFLIIKKQNELEANIKNLIILL